MYVSAASVWEIATKLRLGKLPAGAVYVDDFEEMFADQDFKELPITVRHAKVAGLLPGPHQDPFDRLLIAQTALENLVLVSNEMAFDRYGTSRLW